MVAPWWRRPETPGLALNQRASTAAAQQWKVLPAGQRRLLEKLFPRGLFLKPKIPVYLLCGRRRLAECFNANSTRRKAVYNLTDFVQRAGVRASERKQYSTIFPLLAITRTEKGPSGAALLNLSSLFILGAASLHFPPPETEEYKASTHGIVALVD